MDDLARQAEALYDAIRQVTGCRLVVDASKHPTFGAIARSRPGVDMRVLHMIRDPRASAFSWSRPKPDRGDRSGESMWHAGPMRTTASWVLLNRDHHEFGDRHPDRYRLLRYEDFVASPADALLTIGELAGMDFAGLVRAGDPPSAELAPTHSAWGNPDRFETGPVAIVEDERWKHEMTRLARIKTVAVAAPWMGRYGYSRATRGRMSPRVGDDRTRGHR